MEDLSTGTGENRDQKRKEFAGQNLGIIALITAIITFVLAVIPCIGIIAIIPGIIAIILFIRGPGPLFKRGRFLF